MNSVKVRTRVDLVLLQLLLQGFQSIECNLVAHALHETQINAFAVTLPSTLKEVYFDLLLSGVGFNRGPCSDVDHGGIPSLFSFQPGKYRINASGRNQFQWVFDEEIGRRIAQFSSQLFSALDLTTERIRPIEPTSCLGNMAGLKCFPDFRGTDLGVFDGLDRQFFHGETEYLAQVDQRIKRTLAVSPKSVVISDNHFLWLDAFRKKVSNVFKRRFS